MWIWNWVCASADLWLFLYPHHHHEICSGSVTDRCITVSVQVHYSCYQPSAKKLTTIRAANTVTKLCTKIPRTTYPRYAVVGWPGVNLIRLMMSWPLHDTIHQQYVSELMCHDRCCGDWCGGWDGEGSGCWWSCNENATHWSTTDAISWHADDAHAAWNAGNATELSWNDDAIREYITVCPRSFFVADEHLLTAQQDFASICHMCSFVTYIHQTNSCIFATLLQNKEAGHGLWFLAGGTDVSARWPINTVN